MGASAKLLSAFNRQTRWSEGHIFAFTPEQIGIAEGLRASLAVAVMLGADLALGMPSLAYGAVAAFWTCLCDPGGPDRARLKVMLTFAAEATLAISLAAYCAQWGRPAGGVALFALVLLSGLTRSYRPSFGPMPTAVGLIVQIAVVIGVTSPRDAAGALTLGSGFLLGALWALILCIFLWRTHPRAPARRALAAIFGRLGEMTGSLRQLDSESAATPEQWGEFNGAHRRTVRFSLERGREAVARLATGRLRFTQGIDAAGRVFASLIALGHYRAKHPRPFDTALERPLLDRLGQLLDEAARRSGEPVPACAGLLADATALYRDAAGQQGMVAHGVALAAEALAGLASQWQEPESEEPAGAAAPGPAGPAIPPTVWRHALRVAVAVSVSYSLGAWLDLSFSYWGTIATLVLMQPLGANTWLRVLERAVGSVIGGLLTAILIARLSGPFEMLLFIAPLSAAVIALRLVNYGLFMIFLTPMFVLVSDFIHPASNLISTRALNEAIGAAIGLAGSLLLWPERDDGALSDAVLAAISANLAFAAGVCGEGLDKAALEPLRREAGLTSARAEIARQRLLLQGRSRSAHLDHLLAILVALRSICGAGNILAITRQFEPQACGAGRAERYTALAGRLRQEFLGKAKGAATLLSEDTDDLDRAIRDLTVAVRDYAAEAQ